MNPPARPLKTELNEALVGGIRQRGSEAVGLLIMAMTRIVIALLVLGLQLLVSWSFDYEVTAGPFTGMTLIAGLVSWLTTRQRGQEEDTGVTRDEDSSRAREEEGSADGSDPG